MAFGPSEAIWGARLLPVVRQNLAGIARAIGAMHLDAKRYDGGAITLILPHPFARDMAGEIGRAHV